MALISMLTKQKQARTEFAVPTQGTRVLLVDVTTNRTPTFSAEVTSNPVESGPDVNDHVRPKPVTMVIDGIVSETPLNLAGSLQGLATQGASVITQQLGGFASGVAAVGAGYVGAKLFQTSDNPAEFARKYLEDLISQRTLFTITTKRRKFDNMVLTSLTFPEDSNTHGHLRFSATAQQINVVKSKSVQIENIAKPAAHTAAPKSKEGKQTAQETTQTKRSSILFKGFKAAAGLFGGG